MFPGIEPSQLAGAIEAMLFVSDQPVSTITLADMLDADPSSVLDACAALRDTLIQRGAGVQLREVAGGWQLATDPVYHELLEQYVLSWDTRKLSQAMLEVLSIVAYTQPVTRQGISNVRGVNSDSSINSLLDKGLLRESGVADAPGNPVLYSTTRTFLEKFGLRSLADLPELERFAPDDETRHFISSRLSAAKSEALPVVIPEDDEYTVDAVDLNEKVAQTMQGMLADAIANSSGLVEKIDFDDLEFEE